MKEVKIDTLVPDDKNFNQGTQYGQHLIEESLRRFGAGRSILLDKNNRIIAGNKTIENAAAIGMDNVIVVDTGKYYSMCEHHILPFFGRYYFAYIPKADGKILGISKIARVVGYCSARMQLQERLARQIVKMLADALDNYVEGMAIVMRGTHLCKTMRGVKSNGEMSVSHLSGIFIENADARREFYKLIEINK